ncbi:IS1634 family transposase [Vibrio phage VAP7]|uniref:IS1634 family transposase n=1 Tax=Vibrio phage VAP7 TaxID=2584487 RepID=A0A4Y5TXA6_9CAUD|nr:IS1634 family transposase [Vibrio phage VAP7]QDB73276.1 IS1634 family transposase [Vibrio phage VAP7]UFD98039.1 hypothetical protein [Vibrio phage BX-1]
MKCRNRRLSKVRANRVVKQRRRSVQTLEK